LQDQRIRLRTVALYQMKISCRNLWESAMFSKIGRKKKGSLQRTQHPKRQHPPPQSRSFENRFLSSGPRQTAGPQKTRRILGKGQGRVEGGSEHVLSVRLRPPKGLRTPPADLEDFGKKDECERK
jgi:hypothetical protein